MTDQCDSPSCSRLAVLEEKLRLIQDFTSEANTLRSLEMDRRLSILNNEGDRIKEFQNKSVTRERYDADRESIILRLGSLESFRANIMGKASQSSVVTATMISVAGLILAAVGIILSVTR